MVKPAVCILPLLVLFVLAARADTWVDPHRPHATDERSLRIESFLKNAYCKEPKGSNEGGCLIKPAKRLSDAVTELSNYERKNKYELSYVQHGRTPPEVEKALLVQMRLIGLPDAEVGNAVFQVWGVRLDTSTYREYLAEGNYLNATGPNDGAICQTLILLQQASPEDHYFKKIVLSDVRYHRVFLDDIDDLYRRPLDIADVDHAGQADIILTADEHDNHWLEVYSLQAGEYKMIYSGLGYYQ